MNPFLEEDFEESKEEKPLAVEDQEAPEIEIQGEEWLVPNQPVLLHS